MNKKIKIILIVVAILSLFFCSFSYYITYTFFHLIPETQYYIYPAECHFSISNNDAQKINNSISSELTEKLKDKGYNVNYYEQQIVITNETIIKRNNERLLVWNMIMFYGNKTNSPYIWTHYFPPSAESQKYNEDGKMKIMEYMRNRITNILEVFNITVNWDYAMWIFTKSG
jgi:hypothetical protein